MSTRRYGPMGAEHPTIGQLCSACAKPIAAGDYVTLVPLGPGDDAEERAARDRGDPYNAVTVLIHDDCGPK